MDPSNRSFTTTTTTTTAANEDDDGGANLKGSTIDSPEPSTATIAEVTVTPEAASDNTKRKLASPSVSASSSPNNATTTPVAAADAVDNTTEHEEPRNFTEGVQEVESSIEDSSTDGLVSTVTTTTPESNTNTDHAAAADRFGTTTSHQTTTENNDEGTEHRETEASSPRVEVRSMMQPPTTTTTTTTGQTEAVKDLDITTKEGTLVVEKTLERSTADVDETLKSDKHDPTAAMEEENDTTVDETTTMDDPPNGEAASSSPPQPPSVPTQHVRPVKRARTAYIIFSDEKRSEVAKQHRGVATMSKVMGAMWNGLSEKEKQVYREKASEERTRVASELEAWKKAHPNDAAKATALSNSANDVTDDQSSNLIFPVAKMRRICKLDPDVRGLSKEALVLITKASELALAHLGKETVKVANIQNRRKLLPEDVATVCESREQFQFLREDILDLTRLQQKEKAAAAASANTAAAPLGSASATTANSSGGIVVDPFVAMGEASKTLAASTSSKTKCKPKAIEVAPPPSTKPLSAYFAVKPKD